MAHAACTLTNLGAATEDAMATIYKASYVSLHVRKSNRAAIGLYRDTLGFTVHGVEKGYCSSSSLLLAKHMYGLKLLLQMLMGKMHTLCVCT